MIDYNTGGYNAGGYNAGGFNAGDFNTGNYNAGNFNAGDYNAGDYNTGDFNATDRETGFFNSTSSKTIRAFNKECSMEDWKNAEKPGFIYDINITEWIDESEMTDDEKEENESYKTTKGYLKKYTYKEAWANAYKKASESDIEQLKALPNFDAEVFRDISGIDITVIKVEEEPTEMTIKQIEEKLNITGLKIIK